MLETLQRLTYTIIGGEVNVRWRMHHEVEEKESVKIIGKLKVVAQKTN